MSKLPNWFLWKRYHWKSVGLQTMSLPYDITTQQVNIKVKGLWNSFIVSNPNQLYLYVSIIILCKNNLYNASIYF